MNDLNKPLKKADAPISSQDMIVWGCVAAGVLLLSLTAYVFVDSQESDKQVVALNEQQSKPTVAVNEDGKLDISKVKPLSPLEPLPSTDGEQSEESESRAFKPQPVPTKRIAAWMPNPDLLEKTKFGSLPRISDGGLRPLDAFSQSSGLVGANRVAIIVGGLGISQTGTEKAIESLPPEITLGFSPIGNSLQRWMQKARRMGHEIVLQIPMEPLGYPTIDPGPKTLTSRASDAENLRNLRWLLGRVTNYPLVMNYLGAGVASKRQSIRPILEEIRDRGLGYIDDGSVINSKSMSIAADIRLPNAQGVVILDQSRDAEKIKLALRNLESMSRQKGFVLASATAFPETVQVIADWAKGAEKRGILIVPASNLLKDYSP